MITVVDVAAVLTGQAKADILSPTRTKGLVRIRFAIILALKERHPVISYPAIATVICRDCHTSVMHGYERAQYLYSRDQGFRQLVDDLLAEEWAKPIMRVMPNRGTDDQRHPAKLTKSVKAKNEIAQGDTDARKRLRGTFALGRALDAYFAERSSA